MQIIWKENESKNMCLFDTRSNKFLQGACVRDHKLSDLCDLANDLIKKSVVKIYQIACDFEFNDNGYVDSMIAHAYLEVNPDLLQKANDIIKQKNEKKQKTKTAKFMKFEKKTRKKSVKIDSVNKKPKRVVLSETSSAESQEKKKRGRPAKTEVSTTINQEKKKRGRPKKV